MTEIIREQPMGGGDQITAPAGKGSKRRKAKDADSKQNIRGMGTIYQRGPYWWIVYHHDGRRYRESSDSEKKQDAIDLLKQRHGEIARGTFVPKAQSVTLADLERLVMTDMESSERRSTDRARRAFKHIDKHLGMIRAVNIPAHASEYITTRRDEGAKNATIRYELRLLARAFRLAVRDRRLAMIPVLPSISVNNARQGFVTEDQLDALILRLPDYLRAPTRLAYLTGWRKEEVMGLQWRQVDLEAGIIRLNAEQSKNGQPREFPIRPLPELAALIKEQRDRTTTWERTHGAIVPTVFWRPDRKGGRFTASPIRDFRAAWGTATKAAGIPGTVFHDLRRSAVRNMERAGVPRSVAMKLTGHLTESVYRRYAIVSQSDQEAGVAKIAALRSRRGTR